CDGSGVYENSGFGFKIVGSVHMQDVPWLSDEEQRLWRSILNAKRAVDRSIDLQLQDSLDISTADFSVLVVLSEAED
ncbi:hypothetical protein QP270_26710, partial [Escherichia coli]|nr:hypothetical protein [Escherichia coli]